MKRKLEDYLDRYSYSAWGERNMEQFVMANAWDWAPGGAPWRDQYGRWHAGDFIVYQWAPTIDELSKEARDRLMAPYKIESPEEATKAVLGADLDAPMDLCLFVGGQFAGDIPIPGSENFYPPVPFRWGPPRQP